jgi:hypothetical protein
MSREGLGPCRDPGGGEDCGSAPHPAPLPVPAPRCGPSPGSGTPPPARRAALHPGLQPRARVTPAAPPCGSWPATATPPRRDRQRSTPASSPAPAPHQPRRHAVPDLPLPPSPRRDRHCSTPATGPRFRRRSRAPGCPPARRRPSRVSTFPFSVPNILGGQGAKPPAGSPAGRNAQLIGATVSGGHPVRTGFRLRVRPLRTPRAYSPLAR